MFIAVSIDMASPESENELFQILNDYGIIKRQHNLYESFEFLPNKLGNLKRDIAKCIDMDDKIRMYQYPLDNTLKISFVENGKWKRLSIS
jgi:hypothetical protein